MKTKLTLLLLFLFVCFSKSSAQNKLHVGIELGPRQEHFYYDDPLNLLYKKEYKYIHYGFNIDYAINSKYSIETGVYSNTFASNTNFIRSRMLRYSNPIRLAQIPVRISRVLLPIGNRLQLKAIAGASYSYNKQSKCPPDIICQESWSGGGGNENYSENIYFVKRHIWLAEAGLNASYKLTPNINIGLTINKNIGFAPVTRTYIQEHIEGEPIKEANYYSKGSSTNLLFKVSYKVFDFSKPKNQPDEYFKN